MLVRKEVVCILPDDALHWMPVEETQFQFAKIGSEFMKQILLSLYEKQTQHDEKTRPYGGDEYIRFSWCEAALWVGYAPLEVHKPEVGILMQDSWKKSQFSFAFLLCFSSQWKSEPLNDISVGQSSIKSNLSMVNKG